MRSVVEDCDEFVHVGSSVNHYTAGSGTRKQASMSGWRHPAADTPLPGEDEATTTPTLLQDAHSPMPTPKQQTSNQNNISPLVQRYALISSGAQKCMHLHFTRIHLALISINLPCTHETLVTQGVMLTS